MSQQRYVSAELTHFVGKGLTEDNQYRTLRTILRDGWLLPRSGSRSETSYSITGRLDLEFSENKMFSPDTVCFCDIPVGDLGIHMKKYSRFGLSFLKSFLVQKGTNPVYYVVNDAKLFGGMPQVVYLNQIVKEYWDFFGEMYKRLNDAEAEEDKKLNRMRANLNNFLMSHVFCFMKPFDQSKSDDDPENFYMEREWRKLGGLNFKLTDVRRVILPEEYAHRFSQDVPEYHGQITFAE